jgi:hypothetical protein
MDCPALTSISLGNAIKRIGSRALTGTGIQALDLSANTALQEVGDWAMTLTPVTTAKLPDNVKLLGEGTFLYDNLSSITMGLGISCSTVLTLIWRLPAQPFIATASPTPSTRDGSMQRTMVHRPFLHGTTSTPM